MSEVSGTVAEVNSRDWKNGIVLHNFKLEGSPVVYNCGTQQPTIERGQHIKFRESGKKVVVESIELVEAERSHSVTFGGDPVKNPSTPTVRLDPVAARIQRQQARRDAVTLVTTAMETKMLPYPLSGKNEDKWERMLSLIEETMNDLIGLEENNNE